MATSKGSGVNTKAASKKSAAAKKSAPASGSSRTAKSAAPQKKSAAPKKAAQKSPAGAKGNAATAAKKSAPARNGSASKSASGRGIQARGGGKAAASSSRSTASSRGNGAASRSTSAARGGGAKGNGKAAGADPRNDLSKILQDLMQDIYYAEKKLSKALVKMAKNATDTKLREAFVTHQTQTEQHVSRLEECFELLGQKAKAKKCAAMDGLLEEANEHIEEYAKGAGLDAALIVGAQKVEHYEIAAYGSMRSFAKTLGHTRLSTIFDEIREQESDTDELLTTIAESVVNLQAEGETEDVTGGRNGNNSNGSGARRGSGNNAGGGADSDAGEDSSSAASNTGGKDNNDAGDSNDGAGRGISGMTDGNDRGEESATGAAMGH